MGDRLAGCVIQASEIVIGGGLFPACRQALTISVALGDTSSIKEEVGIWVNRHRLSPTSSLMEEVAAKRSEMVKVTGAVKNAPPPQIG
tara:strand:+ start:27215 stop:27478 length:264 start_codon:yes stop_codon:yes gene_type:complete